MRNSEQISSDSIVTPLLESGNPTRRRFRELHSKYMISDARIDELDRLSELARQPTTSQPKSPYTFGSFFWMVASWYILVHTDFCLAILYDPDVKQSWLLAGVLCIGVTFACAVFCIAYLSWYKKVDADDWDVVYPALFPLATSFFLIGSFFMNVALWPIYSFLTPPMLFTLFMGFVCATAMWPSWLPPFGLETRSNRKKQSTKLASTTGDSDSFASSTLSSTGPSVQHSNLHTD